MAAKSVIKLDQGRPGGAILILAIDRNDRQYQDHLLNGEIEKVAKHPCATATATAATAIRTGG